MRIYPSIDLREGAVVRLIQGDYGRQINYAQDPAELARRYAQAGADWLHVVDLDGAKTGRNYNLAVIRTILEAAPLSVEVGGGVRSRETAEMLLEAGAARVIIGTRSLEDWEWFRKLVHDPALAGKIALGLDAREGRLAVDGWTRQTDRSALAVAREVSDWPLAAIVYTDIARDGMLAGPNVEQMGLMAAATAVPVIASGGVTTLDDVRRLAGLGLEGAIIGRALYEGRIDLAEAVRVAAGS